MRLHRIHVEHFKGIEERTLDVPDSGLVIASGPNEIGKSSLIEALDLVLDGKVKHTSRRGRVLAAQPVGTQLPVVVEAEFTIGEHRVVHRKQFLSSPTASLHFVAGPRAGQHLAGDEAVDTMTSLWDHVDRALWDALRLLEGSGLGELSLHSSTALARALDAASGSGGVVASAQDDGTPLLDAFEREYRTYWTPTGKRNNTQTDPEDELKEVVTQHDHATADLAQVDRVVDELTTSDEDIAELAAQVHEATRRAELAAARTAEVRDLEEILDRAQRRHEDAERTVREAELAASTRSELVDRVTTTTQQADDLERQLATLRERHDEVEAERRTVRDALAEADERLAKARRRAEHADDVVERLEVRQSLDRLEAQLSRADELSRQIDALKEEMGSRPVTAESLARAEETAARLAATRHRVTLASPTLTVERLGDGPGLTLDGAPVTDDLTRSVDHTTRIEVDGAWAFTLTPDQSVDELTAQVERAETELSSILADMGVDDVEAARRRLTERMGQEDRLRGLREDLDRVLDGSRLDELNDERLTLRADLARLDEAAASAAGNGQGDDSPTDPTDPAAARAAVRSARAARDDAQIARDGVATQLEAVTTRCTSAREEQLTASTTLAARRAELVSLTERLDSARLDATDEALEQAATRAREALDEAAVAVDGARHHLAELSPEEVHAADEEAAMHLAGSQRRLTDARSRRARLEGELKGLGREDRQDRADRLAARRHRLEAEVEGTRRRAEAARMLRDALVTARQEQRRAYVAPFRDAVQSIGRQVFGVDLSVEIGDDLSLVSRSLSGRTVAWNLLSTGAREQMGLIVRLAAAQLVDPDDGVPVVLDDALVHSDRIRTRRVLEQLATGTGNTQIVVLTCAPERYDRIASATRVEFG